MQNKAGRILFNMKFLVTNMKKESKFHAALSKHGKV